MKLNEKIFPEPGASKNRAMFDVPEGYFDKFSDRLQARMAKENAPLPIPFLVRHRLQLIGIVSVLLVLISGITVYKLNSRYAAGPENDSFAQGSMLEADVYDLEGTYLIDAYLEGMEEQQVAQLSDKSRYNEEIIEYLVGEDIDLDVIVNQF